MKTYLSVYFGSLLLAVVITPAIILLARKLNAVDLTNPRKVHSKPIPRIGGISVFLPSAVLAIAALFLDNSIGEAFRSIRIQVLSLLGAGTFIFCIGLIDDLRGMRARYKLLAQIIAAVAMCQAGVKIDLLNVANLFTIDFGWLSFPVTIFWIIAITNAVNLTDGLDGLAAGICAVTCGVIAVFAFASGQPMMGVFMLALLGSLSGFLFFNFNPARIFMGDCGSMFLGFVLASSSVMCMTKSGTIVGLALPALALGLPIFDTIFTMLRRYLGRWRIMSPDRSHLHHRLLDMGFRHHHAVITMYVITIIAAGLGMFMMVTRGGGIVAVFLGVLLLLVLVFRAFGAIQVHDVIVRLQRNRKISLQAKEYADIFEDTQLRFLEARTFKQIWRAISNAGEEMGFTELSLTAVSKSSRLHKFTWKPSDCEKKPQDLVSIKVYINENRFGIPMDIEAKIPADNSLESAGWRMMLSGRLIDEYHVNGASKAKIASIVGIGDDEQQVKVGS